MHSENSISNSSQEGIREITNFPAGIAKNRYAADVVNIERRSAGNTVFQVDDATFGSSMPKTSHWSVAWSDLMMTMFVLFLSMFVYQTANQEFLQKQGKEIIGGDTTTALETLDGSGASFPFAPIHQGLPLITAGNVKKVDHIDAKNNETIPENQLPAKPSPRQAAAAKEPEITDEPSPATPPDKIIMMIPQEKEENLPALSATQIPLPKEEVTEPLPLTIEEPEPAKDTSFQKIYALSKDALEDNNLEKFASIDIVPDKTMRIILTSDLLFGLGESELSQDALQSLRKIGAVIRYSPYMINVVGHTDNIPMRSRKFKSNWELSVARASTVVRFLIKDLGMAPSQFVVSGFSSYRPLKPNTNVANRAKNRRVEIIISKQLPAPVPATANNLN